MERARRAGEDAAHGDRPPSPGSGEGVGQPGRAEAPFGARRGRPRQHPGGAAQVLRRRDAALEQSGRDGEDSEAVAKKGSEEFSCNTLRARTPRGKCYGKIPLTPFFWLVPGEEGLRLRELRASVALACQLEQPGVMDLGARALARARGRQRRAVSAAEAVRIVERRSLELFQCQRGLVQLEQHLAEELARRRQMTWRDARLLGCVLAVGRLPRQREGHLA